VQEIVLCLALGGFWKKRRFISADVQSMLQVAIKNASILCDISFTSELSETIRETDANKLEDTKLPEEMLSVLTLIRT
jgi:hypothetical protein